MRSEVRAAGGLLWRDRDGKIEVALAHRPSRQDWSLPKGALQAGEHPLTAACREIAEKTGAQVRVGQRLPSVSYQVPTSYGAADKVVDYWAMRAEGETWFLPSQEVDELRWTPLGQAADTLTYERDRAVVGAFAAVDRPLVVVVLQQHAEAEPADTWDGPDVTRPLSAAGESTAAAMAALLGRFGPVRAISATARRCVQTAIPIAAVAGVEVESDSGFDSEAHARAPEVASEQVRAFATGAEFSGATVVCCEEGVIPDTVALLADTDGLDLPTVTTAHGAAWVLSLADGALVAADYLSPDA